MSFSLYRVVHKRITPILTTERDYEFWPLSQTSVPRWKRASGRVFRAQFGLFYSPLFSSEPFMFPFASSKANGFAGASGAELALVICGRGS